MQKPHHTPLALTMGDPAGIGPDLTISAWFARKALQLPAFIYVGDPDVLQQRADLLRYDIELADVALENISKNTGQDIEDIFNSAIPVIKVSCDEKVVAGQPSSANANAILSSITQAVDLAKKGLVSGVVTCPIAKSVLYEAGFSHPGHTEFLADLAKSSDGITPMPVMMLAGPQLRTVPVTIHIPLMDVAKTLTPELIVQTAQITAHDLQTRFGIEHPRLAISGLNPHAGEDGTMGHEDDVIIKPAIDTLRAQNIDAIGPLPADTMFHEDARANYDVALCMYHDQALIPAKALGFHDAVNVTLGLPFIRTSPDHGTAFGIAGQKNDNQPIARHDSLVAAIKLADKMGQFHIKTLGHLKTLEPSCP